MADQNYFIVHIKRSSVSSPYLTIGETAYHCGVHPELIERFLRLGLIDCAERDVTGEPFFTPDVIPVIRKIVRLRSQLGVNYAGIGVILELMAQIEAMESYVRELERKVFGGE